MTVDPPPDIEQEAHLAPDQIPIADLVNSVVGSQPLNKQPLLIASNVEDELLRLGWPAGLRMGGEPALANRYGVGRDVLREVIRLLEARDHARMRRGPGGGLEIIQPGMQDLIGRLAGYAYVTELDRACILETWSLLQAAAVRVLDGDADRDWRELAGLLADSTALSVRSVGDKLIAETGSRVLAMLGELIGALLPSFVEHGLEGPAVDALRRAQCADTMLDWLRGAELPRLLSRLEEEPVEQRLAAPPAPQSLCFKGQAMQLVHDLMSATAPGQWTRGELIGNEFDLADRFGVDKSIVRQAIRVMEDAETATALPGRGRGLVTRLPSTAPLSRLLCAYFVAHEATAADGERIFAALRMECAGAAADHATLDDKATLLAMMQDLEGLTAPLPVSALQSFERLQQHVAHNSLLGLSIDAVKAFLTWRMATCPIATTETLDTYRAHTNSVTTAICAGNRVAAITAEAEKLSAMSWARAK